MAARMRFSLAVRWVAVIRMSLLVRWVGGVDGVQDAQGAVVVGLQACMFGLAGGAEAAEEGLGLLGVFGPDGPVAGVVGGLRSAGRVTHAGQGPVGVRGAGEFQTERSGRVGEPAVVRRPEVQGVGAFGQQVEHVAVAGLRFGGCGVGGGELAVDVGEELGQFMGARPGGHDSLLVVAELGPDQVQVAFALVLVDLRQQFGLGSARSGGVAVSCGDSDVLEGSFAASTTPGR
jgi:hypothetical protein